MVTREGLRGDGGDSDSEAFLRQVAHVPNVSPDLHIARSRLGMVLRGKYRLDRVLGVGGMGGVYAATTATTKQFAVKMLHPELRCARTSARASCARATSPTRSKHPGAVAVLDDDVAEDGSAFLVMELLEGAPVDELCEPSRASRLPLGVVLAIADALLDVLAAAHAHGIVHRDLKPPNLFLDARGRAQGARLRHRALARRLGACLERHGHGHDDRHAGLHGARAGARGGERGRRADGPVGGGRDDVLAAHRASSCTPGRTRRSCW